MSFFKHKNIPSYYLLSFFIIILTGFLLQQYFISGLYKWHITQTGNHVSIFYMFVILWFSVSFKSSRIRNIFLPIVVLTYSFFTGTLGALLLVMYYSLSFYLLGFKHSKHGLAIQLSYGVIVFLILRSILSIFSNHLLFNEFISTAFVASYYFSSKKPKDIWPKDIIINFHPNIITISFVVISLITIGLNISTTSYDHDSLWYPLRSNALYFHKDFFSDNAYYGQVHYYPKLWESLTNNIFLEYNYSYALSLSSSLYIVLSVIIYSLFQKNRLINTLIIITTPVAVGLSFSIKTDLLLLVLMMIAFLGIEKSRYDIAISALLLSLCVKNSAILFVLAMLPYLYLKLKENNSGKGVIATSFFFSMLSFIVLIIFFYRTYLLTGVPISSPSSLVNILELLGFNYKLVERIPINTHDGFFDLYKIVFLPESLSHHRFFYNGFLWVLSLFVLDAFIAFLLFLMLVIVYSIPSLGDGNYYVVLTMLLTIIFLRKVEVKNIGYVIIASNILISVVANPNWVVAKTPSINNVCNSIFCSGDDAISHISSYNKIDVLSGVINDKTKNYMVISNDDYQALWKVYYKYNVVHIQEFDTWNQLMPMYTLQDYINEHIDILIIENDYDIKVDLSNFLKRKSDGKYQYYISLKM